MSDAAQLHDAASYIPTDRRHALARGDALPLRSSGAALFADISGFTPLTEALVAALGPQRGAEELVAVLTRVWNSLVAEVDDRRGTVINYAGDAMSCWFDDSGDGGWTSAATRPTAVQRATVCALSIQSAMQEFADFAIGGAGRVSLAVKVSVAVGPVVRLVVGDPAVQLVDVQAGETLQRLARAEHQAAQGEVVLDEAAVEALGEAGNLTEWRIDPDTGERFAAVRAIDALVESDPWPPLPDDAFTDDALRPWLLPPVAASLFGGAGEFLTELRPAVSMFVRFGGIDYDADPDAPALLDGFMRAVQEVLTRYEAYILQITIGDKGSYVNTAFGAPIAHGDDIVRAVAAALELRELRYPGVSDLQIGVARGRTRTGATGGVTRRNYGVMGDPVNLSARLMSAAPAGDVLVEQAVRSGAGTGYSWDAMPPLQLKGKAQPVRAFRLVGTAERDTLGLREPDYAQPMVGRRDELTTIEATLDRVRAGTGHVVGITGEAGMGKSRLVAEVIRAARADGFVGFGGECQSYGTNASYLVWQGVLRGLLGIDPALPPGDQASMLVRSLVAIDSSLADRAPLLGTVLNIAMPDTDLTRSFDAALRKASLEALIVDVVRARADEQPLLLVLEDVHWIDPLSNDLLEVVARAIVDVAVMVLVVYRPLSQEQRSTLRVRQLAQFTELALLVLSDDEITDLVQSRLRMAYGDDAIAAPDMVRELGTRAQGNPFYVEELLNYLAERGLDPRVSGTLENLSLPDSLYSLILGRIDQLTEDQRTAMKVASVVGRMFDVATLSGVHPPLAQRQELRRDLEMLTDLDLTLPDVPEPEMTYLFKHALTQEVSYETIAFATRAMLHDQVGQYLEARYQDLIDQRLDLLAHHFDHSENTAKRSEYLRRAGEAAQASAANVSAISYYRRVLPLLEGGEQIDVLLRLAQVLELVGEWAEAEAANREALQAAEAESDVRRRARAEQALGVIDRKRGAYPDALSWMARARASFEAIADPAGMSTIAADMGDVHRQQGRYADARTFYAESLDLAVSIAEQATRLAARARALKGASSVAALQGEYDEANARSDESLAILRALADKPGVAILLNNQGIIARFQGDLDRARSLNDDSIGLLREIGDRWAVGQLLNNQACVAADQRDYVAARTLLADSLAIRRQLGDPVGLALSLNTLADVLIDEGDHDAAVPILDESLALNRTLDDMTAIAYLLEDYAGVAAARRRPEQAMRFGGFAAALREANGAAAAPSEAARAARMLAPAREALVPDVAEGLWQDGRRLGAVGALDELFATDPQR